MLDTLIAIGVSLFAGGLVFCMALLLLGAHKVPLRLRTSKVFAQQAFGQQPVALRQPTDERQELSAVPPDMPAHQATIRHH